MTPDLPSDPRRGVLQAIGAYTVWGLLPLYLHLLAGVPALQVLAHRILWSLLLLLVLAALLRRFGAIRAALRDARTLRLLLASAALITINWLIYIWAVMNGHVLEASLGYFINPLVNVTLGVALLGERLRRLQLVAVALAAVGVIVAAVAEGGALWIPLVLAISFSLYGLIRKIVAIDGLGGLLAETALLAPLCLGWLIWSAHRGDGAFGTDPVRDLFLILAGAVTAVPLILFASAARRLRYATMGLLQYIAPTLQFLSALLFFGELLRPVMLAAFSLIWAACALYAADSLRAARRPAVVV